MNQTSICDVISGACTCLPGFYGYNCEKQCNEGFYGKECQRVCSCSHSAQCDAVGFILLYEPQFDETFELYMSSQKMQLRSLVTACSSRFNEWISI